MMKEMPIKSLSDDIGRDFMHLSQAIGNSDEDHSMYCLAEILEKCGEDDSYYDIAKENIISYLKTNNNIIKNSLTKIGNESGVEFKQIQKIAKELLNCVPVLKSSPTYRGCR